MATTSSERERPRSANGRFAKRRRPNVRNEVARRPVGAEAVSTEGIGQIALLTVAIFLGIAGLFFRPLWIVALVLLGILWGSLAAERSRSGRGVVAEVVDVVVEQVNDVADVAHIKRSDETKDG